MSMLMIWMLGTATLGLIAFFLDKNLRVGKREDRLDTRHAEKMWKMGQELWATGNCPVCHCKQFDHIDECALHVYLGGDAPDEFA
jgi:hypothetical protein